MKKAITFESIRDKSYEEMTYEERQFFCENAHLLREDTMDDNGIIVVDDIEVYKRQRGLVGFADMEKHLPSISTLPVHKTYTTEEIIEAFKEKVHEMYSSKRKED